MIGDLLVEHRWVAPLGLAAVVVAGPVVGRSLVGRRCVAWWCTAGAVAAVVVLTLVPAHRAVDAGCVVQWSLPTPGRAELFANVVLFVPPVLLGVVAAQHPLLALAAGSAGSAAIEATQAIVELGRSCDTNDWSANTIGALIGAVLGLCALRLARVPLRASTSSGPTSTPSSPARHGSGLAASSADWRRGT